SERLPGRTRWPARLIWTSGWKTLLKVILMRLLSLSPTIKFATTISQLLNSALVMKLLVCFVVFSFLRLHLAPMKPPFIIFKKWGRASADSELRRRFFINEGGKKVGLEGPPPPWEGVTWILDLLPNNPRAAIHTLEAYFEAHGLLLPDGRINGLFD